MNKKDMAEKLLEEAAKKDKKRKRSVFLRGITIRLGRRRR